MTTQTFRDLHQGPSVLLLANAWDAGSARLFESLGAPAIATTSAGIAWSKGYPDGEQLPVDVLLAAVRDIARVITVPLSVDIEGGYSSDLACVANAVRKLLQIGAVGVNIEDGEQPPDVLCQN